MHLCSNLSTIKSQKKERKWQKKGSIGLAYTLQLYHSGLSGIIFLMKPLAHADSNSKVKPSLLFENWFSLERHNFSFLNEMAPKVPRCIFPYCPLQDELLHVARCFLRSCLWCWNRDSAREWQTSTQEIHLSKSSHGGWLFCHQMLQAEGHWWRQLHTVMLMGLAISRVNMSPLTICGPRF